MEGKNVGIAFEKKNCCGCGACYSICPKSAIEMLSDCCGFLYPKINEALCIDCSMCVKACPIKNINKLEKIEKQKEHIKIVNLQQTVNYGAIIAGAKLEEAVRMLVRSDIIVETIQHYYDIPQTDFWRFHRDKAKDKQGWLPYIKELRNPYHLSATEKSNRKIRKRRFVLFQEEFLNVTKFLSLNDLNQCDVNDVAYIVGSDVVWQPKRVTSVRAPFFFLDFGSQNAKRISYAPAIDAPVNYRLNKIKKTYRNGLSNFDSISIRESSSKNYLEKILKRKVTLCCDPVLLFPAKEYDSMLKESTFFDNTQKYIYAYILDDNKDVLNYCDNLSKSTGLPIYYYSNKNQVFTADSFFCDTDGPSEFLYRVKNAKYVVTTSYHCAVFSLLFHKQFISFERNFTHTKRSIKTEDLLQHFGLKSRIAKKGFIPNIDDKIDFSLVDIKIDELRTESWRFLANALGKELLKNQENK